MQRRYMDLDNLNVEEIIQAALNRAEELLKLGLIPPAKMVIDQLLRVDPKNLNGLQLKGLIEYRCRNYKDAVDTFKFATEVDPENADNYNNLALCYLHSGNPSNGLESVRKACELKPNDVNFLNNLALLERSNGNLSRAIEVFKESLGVKEQTITWQSLGSAYGATKELDKAIDCFHKAIELNDSDEDTVLAAHVDLAYAYHLKGDWEKAWEEYEYRMPFWHKTGRNPGRFYEKYPPEKNWNGTDSLKGKKVVIYCEQGAGDYIQFVRFVPKLRELGAEVIMDAPVELKSLLENFGEVHTEFTKERPYDYHLSVLSLPYLLKLKHIKGKPYIPAKHLFSMNDYDDFYKVGIVWAGNPSHPNDAIRSCYLAEFKELSEIEGVKLFSFQKDVRKRTYVNVPGVEIDLTDNCEGMKVVDLSDQLTDFNATTSLLAEMDLIITVDTSVMHLAGAIGKETWGLIAYNPDWRWGIEGTTTPWYDCLRLYRQENFLDWKPIFAKIKEDLESRVEASHLRLPYEDCA